jgi:hypothetical protein
VERIIANWKNEHASKVAGGPKVAGGAKQRNELRRKMRALEFFAAAVNSDVLDYELTNILSGPWIVQQHDKLKGFIEEAQSKGRQETHWFQIERLALKLKEDAVEGETEEE